MNPPRTLVIAYYLVMYMASTFAAVTAFDEGHTLKALGLVCLPAALLTAMAREFRHRACVALVTSAAPSHNRCTVAEQPGDHREANQAEQGAS
ncbi:hypothetical protein [Embleya sp. AB8]|uniref:hypothetical protein n=1 Tax=Embleya sp. AB8 TaxID=3156304 RepID=UPI003C7508CA